MTYINESAGGFQKGGCLYKLTSALNGHPSICGCLTCLRNKPQKKRTLTFVSGVVVISYFVDGAIDWQLQCKTFLAIVYECGGFGKVIHVYY